MIYERIRQICNYDNKINYTNTEVVYKRQIYKYASIIREASIQIRTFYNRNTYTIMQV